MPSVASAEFSALSGPIRLQRRQKLEQRDDTDTVLCFHRRLEVRIICQVQVGRNQIIRLICRSHLKQHVIFGVTTQGRMERRGYYRNLSAKQVRESLSRAGPEVAP